MEEKLGNDEQSRETSDFNIEMKWRTEENDKKPPEETD